MRSDDLDDLVFVATGKREQELGSGEVLGLALLAGEHLVGDALDDVLDEGVLAALGRGRIRLDGEHFLPQQRRKERLEALGIESSERAQPLLRERLAEHRAVLHELALRGSQPVEAGGDERMERLRHLELLDRSGRPVNSTVTGQQTSVEQHANCLDGVERDALCPLENPHTEVVGQAGNEARQQLVHRCRRQWLEIELVEPALARPRGALLGELGPRQGEDVQRLVARPVEQVLDEVEQPRVGPLDVLEHEHRRIPLGQSLEQDSPGREQILLVAGDAVFETEQVGDARPHPAPLLRVGEMFLEGLGQLASCRGKILVLQDAAPHAHHLGESPVGNALPVGEAAAAVPERVGDQAVDVLLELPGESRLADPSNAGDEHELGTAFVFGGVEEILDEL